MARTTVACLWLLTMIFFTGTYSFSAQSDNLDQKVEEIRKTLARLPYYGVFDHLAFKYEDKGKLILLGYVTRPSLKKDAENAVERIEWVEGVDNKIEVLPLSPQDDQIRRALYRSIYGQPALQKYGVGSNPSIHIIVNSGRVILEGFVNNKGDKTIAEAQARGVSGIFDVKNNLQVDEPNRGKAE